jgi:myo-inositol 2-dehydrogenase/D-chiro-inositol 1-dehydrogenase
MGADHARIIGREVAGVRLVAVADPDEARAKTSAEASGATRHGWDAMALVEDPEVEAVLVASPDETHADLVLACLKKKKPVLCEKPLASTPEDCLRLVAAEIETGRKLVQVGFMRRFDPAYGELREAIALEKMGRPLLLHCQHRNAKAPGFFTPEMSITNAAVHEFDIIRWLLGAEITAVTVPPSVAKGDRRLRDPLMMLIETTGGVLADLEAFMNAAYGYDVRTELVCEEGAMELARPRPAEVRHGGVQALSFPPDWRGRFHEAYRRQAQAWVRSIAGGGPPVGASAWDGYVATKVAVDGLKALATGDRVFVNLDKKPGFYAQQRGSA